MDDLLALAGVSLIAWGAWARWSPDVAALLVGGVLLGVALLAAWARARQPPRRR